MDKNSEGVCVQSSTIGSLEALLEFLSQMKVPVSTINIGPVHKKDILKATKNLDTHNAKKEFATILAFDVKVTPEAAKVADEENITIFTADIIYNLFDMYKVFKEKCIKER